MTAKQAVDWERVEMLYRAGTVSVREIAAEAGISHTAINKRAKRDEWARDLKAKIKAKADAKVSRATVSSEVSAQTKITEAVRVEIEAEVSARIQLSHRADIGKARRLAIKLLDELDAQTGSVPELEDLGELLRKENANGVDRLNDIYRAVISLPERTKTMKALSESLKNLIGLEREAYGIESLPQTIKTEAVGASANAATMDPIEAAKAYRQFMAG